MTRSRVNSAAYYDQHSDRYIADTGHLDLSPLYARFLAHLPGRARILDAGCGSGRDALAFQRLGHNVVATDASSAMARHASGVLNQEVLHLRHEEIAFVDEFDGIWSNASLLHVPRADLPEVFGRLRRALVPGGVLFTSFKIGEGETFRSERIFTNQTAGSLRELIESVSGLELIESWVSNDLRPGREHEQWLNSLCRRSD